MSITSCAGRPAEGGHADHRPAGGHVRRLRGARRADRAAVAPARAPWCAPRCWPPRSACTASSPPAGPSPGRWAAPRATTTCRSPVRPVPLRRRVRADRGGQRRTLAAVLAGFDIDPATPEFATNEQRVTNRERLIQFRTRDFHHKPGRDDRRTRKADQAPSVGVLSSVGPARTIHVRCSGGSCRAATDTPDPGDRQQPVIGKSRLGDPEFSRHLRWNTYC